MKINKIPQYVQKFAKNIANNDKAYDKINNVILPIGENIIASGMYAYFIDKNKDIEKERKPALQYQNLMCCVAGATLANKVNSSIQKHQAGIIEALKRNKSLKNPEGLINGLKIAMPVIVFTSIIRFLIPVISTPISSRITEYQDKKKHNKLYTLG